MGTALTFLINEANGNVDRLPSAMKRRKKTRRVSSPDALLRCLKDGVENGCRCKSKSA